MRTTLLHISCVLDWSGTQTKVYGSNPTATLHISYVLRWSGTYLNDHGLMCTAFSWISCVLRWLGRAMFIYVFRPGRGSNFMHRKNDSFWNAQVTSKWSFIYAKMYQKVKKQLYDVLNQRFLVTYTPLIFVCKQLSRLVNQRLIAIYSPLIFNCVATPTFFIPIYSPLIFVWADCARLVLRQRFMSAYSPLIFICVIASGFAK